MEGSSDAVEIVDNVDLDRSHSRKPSCRCRSKGGCFHNALQDHLHRRSVPRSIDNKHG